MRSLLFCLAATASLSTAALAQVFQAQVQSAQNVDEAVLVGEAPFLAGQVIVRFVQGVDFNAANQLLDGDRYFVTEELVPALNMFLVQINDGTRVAEAIAQLEAMEAVEYANPDGIPASRQTLPNDPSFGQQWAHTRMQSALAWDFGQGDAQFVISVVDGGCKLNHVDIAPNLYKNLAEINGTPGVDDDGNGYKDDSNGWNAYNNSGNIPNDAHGTHVNGIAGAKGNNGTGVTGVNWNTTLMPVAGSTGSTSIVTKAYNYVYTQKSLWLSSGGTKGANVVVTSNSFGIDKGNCKTTYKAWNDLYNLMGTVGILSCGATANANWNIDVLKDTPTGCESDFMVSVTNTTSADTKNSGAAYGLTTIDLGAPGTGIKSTVSSGGYSNMTGTSMACPQVAGAVAFLHSIASNDFAALRTAKPDQAALELKAVILNNVDPLPSLNGKTVSGGRLNLFRAAQDISSWTNAANGTIAAFGGGLGGANIGSLTSNSIPNINTTLTLNATGFSGSNQLLLLFSSNQANQTLLGGTLLVDLATTMANKPFPVSSGSGSLQVRIPNSPSLVGLVAYAQCGGVDANLPQGTALSNGLTITVGQ